MESRHPTTICAWCGRVIVDGSRLVSHGICDACIVEYVNEYGARPLSELTSGEPHQAVLVQRIHAHALAKILMEIQAEEQDNR